MIRRLGALDCSVDGGDSISEVGGQGPSLQCVEGARELPYLGNRKDHRIAILSIQDTMVRRPS